MFLIYSFLFLCGNDILQWHKSFFENFTLWLYCHNQSNSFHICPILDDEWQAVHPEALPAGVCRRTPAYIGRPAEGAVSCCHMCGRWADLSLTGGRNRRLVGKTLEENTSLHLEIDRGDEKREKKGKDKSGLLEWNPQPKQRRSGFLLRGSR